MKEGNDGEVFFNDVLQWLNAAETPRLPSYQQKAALIRQRVEAEQQKSYFMIYVNQNSVVVLTGFKASTESLLTPFFMTLVSCIEIPHWS